ncbi:MAG: triacylglycerol lipase, partial [Clostridiales bacterium]|nr:triacylglycerol lipase [Clostridiales bacterium]
MNDLDTQYPILLVHGTGFRDGKLFNYWGRIPKALTGGGARIYYGGQDAWGAVDKNARTVADKLDKALLDSGAEKVNIIAHSKGGLDARYLISVLGYAGKVASLTTISTPHRGSLTVDSIMRMPAFLIKFAGFFVNLWFRILGDKRPDFYLVCKSFTTHSAAEFNEQCPDSPMVFYQSYAGAMKYSRSDMFMWLTHAVVKRKSGENDGLVSVESAKWGEFRGVIRGQGSRGVSHSDEVDARR